MQDYIPREIDINQTIPTVEVKQFDNNSRLLHVKIIDIDLSNGGNNEDADEIAFDLDDCTTKMFIKPENNDDPSAVNFIEGTVESAESGIVTFLLPGGVTQTPGRYNAEIWIYGGDETQPIISTKPFMLTVEKSIRNDSAIIASQDFSALDARLSDIQLLKTQVASLVAASGESSGDISTEIQDARVGYDGTTYNSLGDAVRGQAAQAVKGVSLLLDSTGWVTYSNNFNSLPNNVIFSCSINNSSGTVSNSPYNGVINGVIITFGSDSNRTDGDVQTFIPEDGGAIWYREYFTRSGNASWGAWATVYENVPQYRKGINAQYAQYNSHVYEYTKEGTFYATHANWSDLPDNAADFIIQNTRYGDNWVLQTAIQGSSPDIVYQRVVPRSEASGPYAWRRISCDLSGVQSQIDSINSAVANLPQCREGINGQPATYNRHAYEYKKDGTFYVTPANWDDLPSDNANYIITNSRYGSWIMQTAVKSADPAMVYRRFISNNPADDQTAYYTIAANNYGWELCEGVDATKYGETAATEYLTVGLPILYLSGDTEGMSKSNAVTLSYQYGESSGSCSVKWQGSSSIAYTKKNYTITFGTAINVGWGGQRKYCFKANYVDSSNALNVSAARLWSEIIEDRNAHPAITHNAPNNGAMDGFPCIIILNGKFHGLYTWNIPKDKWAFGMGSSAAEYIVTAEQHSDPTKFRTTTDFATDENGKALDFEIEYKQDSVSADTVKTSLNTMLAKISSLTSQSPAADAWDYLDYGTAIDYMIFSALLSNTDGVDKNFILTTYDGVKWWLNAYDLDSILGNFWTGGAYYAPDDSDARNKTSFMWLAGTSRLFNVLWNDHKADVISRYNALRAGILSEENVYMMLYNFCVRIPQVIIDEDNRKYPLKPGTSTETLPRIIEWYRLRCKFIDAEIQNAASN